MSPKPDRARERNRQEAELLGWVLKDDCAARAAALAGVLDDGSVLQFAGHRALWQVIRRLGDSACLVSVVQSLPPADRELLGGAGQLSAYLDHSTVLNEASALHVARRLAELVRHRKIGIAAKQVAAAVDEEGDLTASLAALAAAQASESPASRPLDNIISAPNLVAQDLPPIRYAVPKLIPEGLSILGGPPKTGKSWLVMGLGFEIARGGTALGLIPVEQGSVLYLALEDGHRRLKTRLEKIANGAEIPPALEFASVGGWPRLDNGGLDALELWCDRHPDARLIIIDTLAKVRQGARRRDSLYDEDYRALEGLQKLAVDRNVAVIANHHLRKMSSEDFVEEISGSSGLTGAADSILTLRKPRGENTARLKATGRDLEEDLDVALQWEPETATWRWLGDASQYLISEERKEILAVLGDGTGHSLAVVAERLGKPESTVRGLLWRMANDGQIAHRDGKYGLAGFVEVQVNSFNQTNASTWSTGSTQPPDGGLL